MLHDEGLFYMALGTLGDDASLEDPTLPRGPWFSRLKNKKSRINHVKGCLRRMLGYMWRGNHFREISRCGKSNSFRILVISEAILSPISSPSSDFEI